MISDEVLDNLLQPIIERQEEISNRVIEIIVNRIREINGLTPSDLKRLLLLMRMGDDAKLIVSEIARLSNIQEKSIKQLIKTVAVESYMEAKPFYDFRHKSFIPFEENKKLQQITTAIANETANTYKNISNSKATGFLIRDLKNPTKLKFYSATNAYQSAVDEAIQSIKFGVEKPEVAIRRTIRQLSESGIRLKWDSGYTQRLDSAVRRNILDGVRALNMQIEQEIGRQIGADGIELSAHPNSAQDHEPFQGHIFTNNEFKNMQNMSNFKDIRGNTFSAIERSIGMWNCRHYIKSIIIDAYKPKYTQKQLTKYITDNHKGYTTKNGTHLTLYQCTQYQRQLETKIRQAKDSQIAFRKVGDMEEARRYQSKINQYTAQYKAFSKSCGLNTEMNRTVVYKYHRIKTD